MATVQRFEDLIVWQKARDLSNRIYKLTLDGTFAKDYELRNQINRSSGSVMDNIAEGFGRGSRAEFVQFMGYSMGSLNESKSQLYRAHDRNHIDSVLLAAMYEEADVASRMLRSLMARVKESPYKGYKFKEESIDYGTAFENNPAETIQDMIILDKHLNTDTLTH